MAAVWADSSIKSRSQLLVLLAIADNANLTDGTAWPSIDFLAKKARCSQRSAQDAISALISQNKLEVNFGSGPKGTNIYKVIVGGVQNLRGATSRTKTRRISVRPVAPKPSLTISNHQEPSKEDLPSELPLTETDHQKAMKLWCDSFKETFGMPYTVAGGRDGKAVKALLLAGWSPQQVIEAAKKAWRQTDTKTHWACVNRSKTLHGFADAVNQILLEISKPSAATATADRDRVQVSDVWKIGGYEWRMDGPGPQRQEFTGENGEGNFIGFRDSFKSRREKWLKARTP
jgi:Helix-turn-helix domain